MKDLVAVAHKVKASWKEALGDVRAEEETAQEEPEHLREVVGQAGLPVVVEEEQIQLVPAKAVKIRTMIYATLK